MARQRRRSALDKRSLLVSCSDKRVKMMTREREKARSWKNNKKSKIKRQSVLFLFKRERERRSAIERRNGWRWEGERGSRFTDKECHSGREKKKGGQEVPAFARWPGGWRLRWKQSCHGDAGCPVSQSVLRENHSRDWILADDCRRRRRVFVCRVCVSVCGSVCCICCTVDWHRVTDGLLLLVPR